MKDGIVTCPIHGDNETTSNCPDCREYTLPEKFCYCGKPVDLENPDCVQFDLCSEHQLDA